MRIASIQLFGDYLCGMNQPYLKYNSKRGQFESAIELDDIEGQPGLKLKTIQETAFHDALKDYMSKRNGEQEEQEDETSFEDEDDEDDNIAHKVHYEENNDDDEEEDEKDRPEVELNVSPAERRKIRQYRWLRKQNVKHGKYFRLFEVKMIVFYITANN